MGLWKGTALSDCYKLRRTSYVVLRISNTYRMHSLTVTHKTRNLLELTQQTKRSTLQTINFMDVMTILTPWYRDGNSTDAEVSIFHGLFANLQLVDARKGIRLMLGRAFG